MGSILYTKLALCLPMVAKILAKTGNAKLCTSKTLASWMCLLRACSAVAVLRSKALCSTPPERRPSMQQLIYW